ncbi:MAG: DUF3810 family protein [Trueperaceae bacterium]
MLAASLWLLPQAAFAQFYGRLLYPGLSGILTTLTSWTSFPLGLAVVPLLSGLLLWRSLAPGQPTPLVARLLRPLPLVVALWALYMILWGVNYRRPPLLELLGVPNETVSSTEMSALAEDLLRWITSSTAADGDLERNPAQALAEISEEIEGLALEINWPAHLPQGVKNLPSGTLLSSGYAGMLFPFTLEPQVDAGLSNSSRVAVGAHELAHVAGFAAEADADLAALIAGLRSHHPFARYSTALSLLSRMLGSMPEGELASILERLPERARIDLADARARSARYLQRSLAERVTAVYHRLLQGQGVESGVGDYGRAPQLTAQLHRYGLLPQPP